MRKLMLVLVFIFGISQVQAQDVKKNDIEVGDLLEIGSPETSKYKYIDFPRPNFIIKKGGIADIKAVKGEQVVITSIKEAKDGSIRAKIKRADGKKFFNSHVAVMVDLNSAIAAGELNVL